MVRRFLVGLAAAVLAVSVLTVAGSPVGAANTASEVLYDHDSNAATLKVRQFAGANRYATSIALAEAFVTSVGSGGFADSVIVASGESLVDAAAAAGLAASKSAPVVLTTPDRLSSGVESFIVEEFVSEVFILGGLDAISQEVEDALTALAPVRTVKRLSGTDRYATSVALAEEQGSPGEYCDSGLFSAILVNVDSSFADVIAVGPLAYALDLPVLLTRADGLPDTVSAHLTDSEIERIVIIGGETSVSVEVVSQLTDLGITDVVRIGGENRFATALAIRSALVDCANITVSSSQVALINGEAAADGVAAGPLLGSGLVAAGVTPVLLVKTDELPAETRSYLASIPLRSASAAFIDVGLVAIGGTAVVPQEIVQAAVDAATTSKPITATIKVLRENGQLGSEAKITFSALVDESTAINSSNYRIAGARPFSGDIIRFVEDPIVPGINTVSISLRNSEVFTDGTEITIVGGKIKGRGTDNRSVEGVTYTIPTVSSVRDNARPRVQIATAAGAHELRVEVTDQNLAGIASDLDFSKVKLNGEPLPWSKDQQDRIEYFVSTNPAALGQPALDAHNSGIAGNPWEFVSDIAAVPGLSVDSGHQAYSRNLGDITTPLSEVKETSSLKQAGVASLTSFIICLFGKEDNGTVDPSCLTTPQPAADFATETTNPITPTIRETISGVAVESELRTSEVRTNTRSDGSQTLIAGDRITFEEGAFNDVSGNPSRTTTFVVKNVEDAPRVTRASVTKPVPYDNNGAAPGGEALAQWRWLQYEYDCNGPTTVSSQICRFASDTLELSNNYLTITAKPDGIAAGAIGNAWRVEWSELPDILNDDGVPAVQVDVPIIRRVIQVKFDNEATLGNVLDTLLENESITENFAITSDGFLSSGAALLTSKIADSVAVVGSAAASNDLPDIEPSTRPSGPAAEDIDFVTFLTNVTIPTNGIHFIERGAPTLTARNLSGGESSVTVTLAYNDVLETFKFAADPADPAVETGTLRLSNVDDENYPSAAGWNRPLNIREVANETYSQNSTTGVRTHLLVEPTLVKEVVFVLHSATLSELPVKGNTISLPAGVAEDYSGRISTVVTGQELRAG